MEHMLEALGHKSCATSVRQDIHRGIKKQESEYDLKRLPDSRMIDAKCSEEQPAGGLQANWQSDIIGASLHGI
jgi:hypothetical protein